MATRERPPKQKKQKREMTPEARERLSRLAKERHARGEFGGSKFGKLGGRPRKDRAAARVAEAAQADATARRIIEVFNDAIDPSQPMSIRLKAASAWLDVERQEANLALQEADAEAKHHNREELIAILSKKLTQGPTAHILRQAIEAETGITDAVVVESEAEVVEGQAA